MTARHIQFPEDQPFARGEIATYYHARFGIDLKREETRVPCPVHKGQGLNLSINAENGLAKCHSGCQRGWDIYALESELFGGSFPDVKRRVFEVVGRGTKNPDWTGTKPRREVIAFDYTDEQGVLLYQNVRYEPGDNGKPKTFRQRAANGDYSVKGIGRVPFQLPLVAKAKRVAVCEGEKDSLTLTNLGFIGTCNSGGATHWTEGEASYLVGKELVAILPDNDEPGRKHAAVVAASLAGRVGSLRVVPVPEPHKDVSDWVGAGATVEDVELAIEAAPDGFNGSLRNRNETHPQKRSRTYGSSR